MKQNETKLSRPYLALAGRNRHRQAGASLIEVMIAFLILSIGLLGLAMLQGKSLRLNTDAYLRSQATLIAHELMENMRANPTGNYAVLAKPGPCGCSGIAKATNDDLIRWYGAQETLLPFDSAKITKGTGQVYTIEMKWKEREQTVTQSWVVSL